MLEGDAPDDVDVAAPEMKGFWFAETEAEERSNVNCLMSVLPCWVIVAEGELLLSADPCCQAAIKGEEESLAEESRGQLEPKKCTLLGSVPTSHQETKAGTDKLTEYIRDHLSIHNPTSFKQLYITLQRCVF